MDCVAVGLQCAGVSFWKHVLLARCSALCQVHCSQDTYVASMGASHTCILHPEVHPSHVAQAVQWLHTCMPLSNECVGCHLVQAGIR